MTISEENWHLKNEDERRVAAKVGGPSILRFGLSSADPLWGCPEPLMSTVLTGIVVFKVSSKLKERRLGMVLNFSLVNLYGAWIVII
jgi:hypothetical protein